MMQITVFLDDSALSLGAIIRLRKNLFAGKAAVRIIRVKSSSRFEAERCFLPLRRLLRGLNNTPRG